MDSFPAGTVIRCILIVNRGTFPWCRRIQSVAAKWSGMDKRKAVSWYDDHHGECRVYRKPDRTFPWGWWRCKEICYLSERWKPDFCKYVQREIDNYLWAWYDSTDRSERRICYKGRRFQNHQCGCWFRYCTQNEQCRSEYRFRQGGGQEPCKRYFKQTGK